MKYLLVAAALCVAAAPVVSAPPVPQRNADLREVVQQYPATAASAPRRLTTAERAELRRQLVDYSSQPQQRSR